MEDNEQMGLQEPFELTATKEDAGQRLDAWLSVQIIEFSRSRIQALIHEGAILVDGFPAKPNHRLKNGDSVQVRLPLPEAPEPTPEAIDLDIVYEDESIVVINKSAGMVTHPAPGHSTGTLVNALLHHCTDLSGIGGVKRPGIIHRLDAETTGLLVVAKNDAAHRVLAEAMEKREISRLYVAVVAGVPKEKSGTIELPIGRSRSERTKMAIDTRHGRRAVTHWEVLKWGPGISVLRLKLETGRTHQIRVHLASRMMPVIGDRVYGWTVKREMELIPRRENALIQVVSHIKRQMLHAAELELRHPITGAALHFEAPIPEDMQTLIDAVPAQLTQQQLERQAEERFSGPQTQ